MLALRRLLRPSGLRAPPAAAASLHGPPQAALLRLLERWRARRAPPPLPPRPPGVPAERAAPRAPPPPGEAALQALFRSPPFCHRRPARFARTMAAWFPREAEGLSPATVALIAKYLARHRLRQPPLLDALAAFLLRRAPQMDTKMIQKLVFPFSRTNYRPSNHPELFSQLESVLVQKAAASPLATVNILMSLVQLRHFPLAVLHKVFSPSFLDNVTSSPCGLIVRRYLSLLDAAVALEVQGYDGPRLGPQYRVCMFDGALTADEANHKYSYKGLVAEALRQLVGEEGYRQNAVVPPGYSADFLLQISYSGSVLPPTSQAAAAPLDAPDLQTRLTLGTPSGSLSKPQRPGSPSAGRLLLPEGSLCPLAPQGGCSCCLREEPHLGTSALTSPSIAGSALVVPPCGTAEAAPLFRSPILVPEPQPDPPEERRLLLATPVATLGAVPGGTEEAEEIHRMVLLVNDKWHYCQDSAVLVGSRAMCNRHLLLLGYHLVQHPLSPGGRRVPDALDAVWAPAGRPGPPPPPGPPQGPAREQATPARL